MAVQLIEKTIKVPKELDDVAKALVHLLAEIKGKKDISIIVGGSLPHLMSAMEGMEQIPEEVKTKEAIALLGLTIGQAVAVFVE